LAPKISWPGVFPPVTTQFKPNFDLDIDATHKVLKGLADDGVSELIACGTVGENISFARDEKIAVMEAVKDVAKGRAPVICGVVEFTTQNADADKTYVENIMAKALQNKPTLLDVGLLRAATVNETGWVPAT
jgi:dihydrodipicolinate synthase/N-acetylneuraminate lyase